MENHKFTAVQPASSEMRKPGGHTLWKFYIKKHWWVILPLTLLVGGSIFLVNRSTNQSPMSTQSSDSQTAVTDPCQQKYEAWLTQKGQDYKSCLKDVVLDTSCTLPEGMEEAKAGKRIAIEIILDSSGSMAALIGGKPKMDIAKEVLTDFVTDLPEETLAALRIYGHKGSNAEKDKQLSCNSSELLYEFAPVNKAEFQAVIDSLTPVGWTPIDYSLQLAKGDLDPLNDGQTDAIVFLVSDGEETCNGDPVARAKELKASGIDPVINVIGFDVGDAAQRQLQEIAKAGGGKYFSARSQGDLQAIFEGEQANIRDLSEYKLCLVEGRSTGTVNLLSAGAEETSCLIGKQGKERIAASVDFDKILLAKEITQECRDTMQDAFNKRDSLMTEFLNAARQQKSGQLEELGNDVENLINQAQEEFFK